MRRSLPFVLASLVLFVSSTTSFARDVDGLDCGRIVVDYGDAPEGIPFFGPFGPVLGHYPTCLAPGPVGTQELFCAPRSTPPGPTGYMRNYNTFPSHYWLGCFDLPTIGLTGIDDDIDGKVGPPGGPSACSGGPTDGDVILAPNSFSQDEDYNDGDAGLYPNQLLLACSGQPLVYQTANCGNETIAYLNVLVDLNFDGDWNDNLDCSSVFPAAGCVHEWAVKNVPISIGFGCQNHNTPPIFGGPIAGQSWVRISLTDEPVAGDFPWAGSANQPNGQYAGGETEDYLLYITFPDAVKTRTWGQVKTLYR
jgi:hypothetical protein